MELTANLNRNQNFSIHILLFLALLFGLPLNSVVSCHASAEPAKRVEISASTYDHFRKHLRGLNATEAEKEKRTFEAELRAGRYVEQFKEGTLTPKQSENFSWLTYKIGALKIKLIELGSHTHE